MRYGYPLLLTVLSLVALVRGIERLATGGSRFNALILMAGGILLALMAAYRWNEARRRAAAGARPAEPTD